MSQQQEAESSFGPAVKIPQKLLKQSADRLALNIIRISLPIIEKCFEIKTDDQNAAEAEAKEVSRDLMLDYAKRLKVWYWNDTIDSLGEQNSHKRYIITKSLLDVLEVNMEFRDTPAVYRFCLQVLFGCEAGDLEGISQMDIESRVSHQLSRFLTATAPFYIQRLHDRSLKFSEPVAINLLLFNSENLKQVHLHHNLSGSTMDRLRLNCREVEIITLDVESESATSLSMLIQSLFRTFFGDKNRDYVLKCIENEKPVPISFRNLKEVWIRSDLLFTRLMPFVQSIQHYYTNVKTKITCLSSVPYGGYVMKVPFICPSFQVESLEGTMKKICVYFSNEDLKIDDQVGPSPTDEVNVASFLRMLRIFLANVYYLQDIMSMLQICNLRYLFCEYMKVDMSPRMPLDAEKLTVLYIFGPIPDEDINEELTDALNQCCNLKVLCFMVKPMCSPVLEGLNPLNKLEILSIHFTALEPNSVVGDCKYSDCLGGSLKESTLEKFMVMLIKASPNLKVLEVPCKDCLRYLIQYGNLKQLHTLSVLDGHLDIIQYCIMNLRELKVVMLEKNFDFNEYLELKRKFYHTNLKVVFKKTRYVLPFIF